LALKKPAQKIRLKIMQGRYAKCCKKVMQMLQEGYANAASKVCKCMQLLQAKYANAANKVKTAANKVFNAARKACKCCQKGVQLLQVRYSTKVPIFSN
jgi:hypothetical protein